ncbi:ankyrin repeat domain-containing protein, partial [bacterium]|nr:ankyrin repeat domain-containing protein [bacterium]
DLAGVQAELNKGVDVNAKDDDGSTPLHEAAQRGHKETAELLIANGADVNARTGGWMNVTPLHRTETKEIAELLIANGANVNAKDGTGRTPLHWTAETGRKEIAELLIEKGADVNAKDDAFGWTPLHIAALFAYKEIAELLIAAGADVNAKGKEGETPLDVAVDEDSTETADLLRKHGGKTGEKLNEIAKESILGAVEVGDIDWVIKHLEAGADVNAKDKYEWTPLHIAAYYGHEEIVELLIRAGADVNAKDVDEWTALHMAYTREVAELLIDNGADVNAKTDDDQTPLDVAVDEGLADELADLLRKRGGKTSDWLSDWNKAEESIHIAVRVGHIEAVKQHLAAGVDANAKEGEWGYTLLHSAVDEGHKEVAELLIANGADVNAAYLSPGTELAESFPLHQAVGGGHKEIVELLITAGADVNAKNIWGETPLIGAARGGHKEVAELLIAEGTNVNTWSITGTPLDSAIGYKHPETADLIRKHGGKTGEELKALMPRLVQHGQFAFSFVAKKGKVYEVQDSFDLLNWEVIKTYTGTGFSVRFDEERDHDPPQWFYRVKVVE